jgi:hypothetical protein
MSEIANKSCIVVGDIYQSFAKKEYVIKETDMSAQLINGSIEFDSIILGQGLSKSIDKLLALAKSQGVECLTQQLELATPRLTHKSKAENILISKPVNICDRQYKFQLIIGSDLDRLSDHVTGEHIGAMLLIEAARQGGIGVLELEFPETEEDAWGYILHKFDTEFSQYAFPIPTDIYISVEEDNVKNANQRSISLGVRFYQNTSCISEMTIGVQLLRKKLLKKIEHKKSHEVCSALIAREHNFDVDIERA